MKQSLASLTLETKDSAPDGTFEGYGAVFGNTDRDGDIVAPGAFAESLKERLPALLWQHNVKEPIGRFDVVREDKKGLYVKGRLSAHGRGREAYDLLKMGALDGLSIGFVTKEAQRSRASGTRIITKADLMEVSLVTFPANELARISTVKQRTDLMTHDDTIDDPRSFERFLRENGFSRSRAKAITAKGFRGVESSHDLSKVIEQLQRRNLDLSEKVSCKSSTYRNSQIVTLTNGKTTKLSFVPEAAAYEIAFTVQPVADGPLSEFGSSDVAPFIKPVVEFPKYSPRDRQDNSDEISFRLVKDDQWTSKLIGRYTRVNLGLTDAQLNQQSRVQPVNVNITYQRSTRLPDKVKIRTSLLRISSLFF